MPAFLLSSIQEVFQSLDKFWRNYPALLYGVAFLLGCQASLTWHAAILFPIAVLWLPLCFPACRQKKALTIRLTLALMAMLSAVLYIKATIHFPDIPNPGGIKGKAEFEIASLSSITKHFGKRWAYQGRIKSFVSEHNPRSIAMNVPCTVHLKQDTPRPPADCSYVIEGVLKEAAPGKYILIPSKEHPWLPVAGSWSLAGLRFQAKQWVSEYIHNHIKTPSGASFLSGIATGDFQDRLMSYEFGRFGLQHIMAISGFHFAIVAGILNSVLRLFLSKKTGAMMLIALISSYFVFLGCGPSIMRAWITIMIALAGYLIEKRGTGLNSLGVALLAILIFDPQICRNIGFQFSFMTTAAILMLFGGCDELMQKIYVKRPLHQMIEMDRTNQHGYFLLACFRQAIALGIAVNLAALPMSLYYFHKFPFLSLLYNLFFPFMVSISMLLLILGSLLTLPMPPLGHAIHHINGIYTRFMLDYVYHIPTSLDVYWRVHKLSGLFVIVYLSLVFCAGVALKHYFDKHRGSRQDFAFL